jgi:hypothetical protein
MVYVAQPTRETGLDVLDTLVAKVRPQRAWSDPVELLLVPSRVAQGRSRVGTLRFDALNKNLSVLEER